MENSVVYINQLKSVSADMHLDCSVLTGVYSDKQEAQGKIKAQADMFAMFNGFTINVVSSSRIVLKSKDETYIVLTTTAKDVK